MLSFHKCDDELVCFLAYITFWVITFTSTVFVIKTTIRTPTLAFLPWLNTAITASRTALCNSRFLVHSIILYCIIAISLNRYLFKINSSLLIWTIKPLQGQYLIIFIPPVNPTFNYLTTPFANLELFCLREYDMIFV